MLTANNEENFLMISGIQHFSFCRRQWALIHIEEKWLENRLTAEGNLVHTKVHNYEFSETRNGILTCRDMQIKSDKLGITGKCDAVEFIPCDNGIQLYGRCGSYIPYPIEYKHGSSKTNDCDRLQLTAQVMCLEEMLFCHIPEGALFYFETRRREKIEITRELRESVQNMVFEMHDLYNKGYVPKVKKHKGCSNCSLADECLPEISAATSVSKYIKSAITEGANEETT